MHSYRHWKFSALFAGALFAAFAGTAQAQHEWQRPSERDPADVKKIIGTIDQKTPSRDLNILWVWGLDYDHGQGFHEYPWVMDLFVNQILPEIPKVSAAHAMKFPTADQWNESDLVVFYHHAFEQWNDDHYEQINAFKKRGGGIVIIHESTIQRPGEALAECVGLAWGTPEAKNGQSGWGLLPTPVALSAAGKAHSIFAGFGDEIDLVDEFYWNLAGDESKITPMLVSPAGPGGHSERPHKKSQLDGEDWPVMWTKEEGDSRMFVSVPGHNYTLFNDPYFRIILLRAMAWTLHEDFDPFEAVVMKHIDDWERED
jgi:hypothetical protein